MSEKAPSSAFVADLFTDNHALVWFRQDWYRPVGNCWVRFDRHELRKRVYAFIAENLNPVFATSMMVRSVCEALEHRHYIPGEKPPPFMLDGSNPGDAVVFTNGVLLVDQLIVGKLPYFCEGYCPELFATSVLPFAFDPKANAPRWREFLEWFTGGDAEIIDCLQRFVGSCFLPGLRIEKFLWLCGTGSNGKSVFKEVIRQVLGGESAVSTVSLERLTSSRFDVSQTVGKLLNISDEPNRDDKLIDGAVKAFTSQETISVDRKYRELLQVRPTARLMVVANHFPFCSDRSDAVWRRLILMHCNARVTGAPNLGLADELVRTEAAGILNWILAGARKLSQARVFHVPAVIAEAVKDERLAADPVATWLADTLVADSGVRTSYQTLYSWYVVWAIENGYKQKNIETFKRDLHAALSAHEAFHACHPSRWRFQEGRVRGIHGLDKHRPHGRQPWHKGNLIEEQEEVEQEIDAI